jgi:hypothetical protein
MSTLLTIAIPTINRRQKVFNELCNEFKKQSEPYGEKIDIIYYLDNGELTIGEKRNKLNEMANGKYIVQWDDDDWICEGGIDMIMKGIESDCDVITYNHYTDIKQWGKNQYFHKYYSIKFAPPKEVVDYENNIIQIVPDQKCVIKSEIAKQIKFLKMNFQEDMFYGKHILPHIKNEFYINQFIYLYLNRANESMEIHKRYKIIKSSNLL